mgnify:CR=1 FL=1|jgi:hypothetical protein
MIATGAVVSLIGAAIVLLDMFARWRGATNVIDGGNAGTDHAAELRRLKRRGALSMLGPLLVMVGSVLTLLGVWR